MNSLRPTPPVVVGLGAQFVGRRREVEAITTFVDGVRGGRVGFLLVEAEAGCGKSSVSREALHRCRGAGDVTIHAGQAIRTTHAASPR